MEVKKVKKKIVSLMLAAAMVATVAIGCGNGGSAPASSSAAAGSSAAAAKTIKVGVINNDPNESGYRKANDEDLRKTFTKENGYEAEFVNVKENADMIKAADKFITDGVDYILLAAADTAGWDATLKKAQDAKVKVILFDRMIDADESLYETAIVSDMAQEGKDAVAWLESQKLEKYNIIHIQGKMGTDAQKGRTGALDEKVKADPNWTIVKQQTGNWSAEEAEKVVNSVIKKDFNVIYAENDDMAKGAVAALDKANIKHGVGEKVIVMGFDCNKWALQELEKKAWNFDGQCNPFQSSYIVETIKKLEAGEKVEKKQIMKEKTFDATTITKEDIEKYGI